MKNKILKNYIDTIDAQKSDTMFEYTNKES